MTGQIRILRQQDCWCFTGETLEVTNQVRLVVIAASNGRVHPVAWLLSNHTENLDETLHAAEELWRQTNARIEAALELADAQAKFPS